MMPNDTIANCLHITARADCTCCHGEGYAYDLVPMPFGPGNCSMPSLCGCVEDQIPDEANDEVQIIVVPAAIKGEGA